MLQTQFGDHPSIRSEEMYVLRFVSILSLSGLYNGRIKLLRTNLILNYLRMLHAKFGDNPSINSVQKMF
jgi:hypothetical protein